MKIPLYYSKQQRIVFLMKKPTLLIIEDEEPIRQGLIDLFVFHGYDVDWAEDGKTGLEKALRGQFDMILLDIMLPEMDGYQVCEEIRRTDREQPIIMLTARSNEEDIISGLSLGADDYVAKPFSIQQLLLRVDAVLRRSRRLEQKQAHLNLPGNITVDTLNLTISLPSNKKEIPLTKREVEFLAYLCKESHRPVPREELLVKVWGYHPDAKIETRTVDIHVVKLRRKIEQNPKQPKILVTIRGEGYTLSS
ncbi:MAG: response regulator transcription factor [Planctomycetes bacterium]|nr:response regulator transcription factor [Planctomycetota bacterium]